MPSSIIVALWCIISSGRAIGGVICLLPFITPAQKENGVLRAGLKTGRAIPSLLARIRLF